MPPNVDRVTHCWQDGDAGRTELIPTTTLYFTGEFGNKARAWREVAVPASTEDPLYIARQRLCASGTLKREGERKVIPPGTEYLLMTGERRDSEDGKWGVGRDGLPASHNAK